MRIVGWIVLASLGLAMLRLAVTLAVIAFGLGLLWALITAPQTTIAMLVLFGAISIAKAQPLLALAMLLVGVGISRIESGAER